MNIQHKKPGSTSGIIRVFGVYKGGSRVKYKLGRLDFDIDIVGLQGGGKS